MNLSRRSFLIATGAALIVPSAPARADLLQIEGPAFGASFRVRVPVGADAAAVARAITGVIAEIDGQMSPFRADSALTAFNAAQTRDALPLPTALRATLAEARRVATLTGGAFDPTLGGVTGRLGFGPITTPPRGAFADLALTPDGARKADPAQTLDLCGIAKGQALDRCLGALAALGLRDAFVELGGEVAALGQRPGATPWHAGIAHPLAGPPVCVVALDGRALATSGDGVNGYDLGGRRVSHIIDPRQRAAVTGALASVSVLAGRGITADALATALFALGADAGPALAQTQGIDALFLIRDGAGLRRITTGGFGDRIIEG